MAYKRKIYHRDENCLNCGYPIIGNYCGECGQKAHLHKDSFWHLSLHFIGDYFHYDNKFWTTIKTMFTKPGLITKEFTEGKRVKYLNPIQLYIFVTTVFFLSVYSINSIRNNNNEVNKESTPTLKNISDSLKHDTDIDIDLGIQSTNAGVKIGLGEWTPKERSLLEYDSVQHILPENQKDGFIKSKMIRKSFMASENENFSTDYKNALRKNIPKAFFILLPFFAFLLFLVNLRRKIHYIDHIIFSIHFHSFSFLLVLFFLILGTIIHNEIFDNLLILLIPLGLSVYLLLSLKKVYNSVWWKTILKLLFVLTFYLTSFVVILLLLLSYSFLTL